VKYHFRLQYTIWTRKVEAFGINRHLAAVLSLFALIGLPYLLYQYTAYASLILVVSALFYCLQLSNNQRNEFLRRNFSARLYRLIRLTENGLVCFPFLVHLLIQKSVLEASVLLVTACLLSMYTQLKSTPFTLPVPFGHRLHEFSIGLRAHLPIVFIAYALAGIGWYVDNPNLGIASIVLIFLLGCSFYLKPEPVIEVWRYALAPAEFLKMKWKYGLQNILLIAAPLALVQFLLAPEMVGISLAFVLLGCLALMLVIVVKYAVFPAEMSLPEAFVLGFSLWLPFLLPIMIPVYFNRAKQKLADIL